MIKMLEMFNGVRYILNQSRHIPDGWMPEEIADNGNQYHVFDNNGLRASISKRYVVSVVYGEEK